MKQWYFEAFQAIMRDGYTDLAPDHVEFRSLDRVLKEKLFPDRAAEHAHLQWLEAHRDNRSPSDDGSADIAPDFGIDR